MALTIFQAIIFMLFITFLIIKFNGPISSISNSWYLLTGKSKILFILFCFSLGILMLFQSAPSILFFLSGSALSFVGITCTFKDNWITPHIHSGCAAICIILALLGIGIELHNWIPLLVCVVSGIAIKLSKVKNGTFWIEILAFLTIISGLLF